MKKRLDVEVEAWPEPPEQIVMNRRLAMWLGALPPTYGLTVEEPVLLVSPRDGLAPGLFWPIDLDAYRKE